MTVPQLKIATVSSQAPDPIPRSDNGIETP
jgi:hypothetical protein